jgi:hypothetical protein
VLVIPTYLIAGQKRSTRGAAAGFPSTPPEAIGRDVTFTGTDTLRIADGKVAAYWATPTASCSSSNSAAAKCPPQGDL